ncbi:MAG: hypothetical protein IKX61_02445 [Prevotella sp.]|nr:hypothetical protein [Prevotella sp.]
MEHLTDEIVNDAIRQVIGEDEGWSSNGPRAEGWSITIDIERFIFAYKIERLRLRLNTIERNLGGKDKCDEWRIRFYKGKFELRYLHKANCPASDYHETIDCPMFDDEDGDAVDGRLSLVAYMVRIVRGEAEAETDALDFANDFVTYHKNLHYLFNGQRTYDKLKSYLWHRLDYYRCMKILNKIVVSYRSYCWKKGLTYERIHLTK